MSDPPFFVFVNRVYPYLFTRESLYISFTVTESSLGSHTLGHPTEEYTGAGAKGFGRFGDSSERHISVYCGLNKEGHRTVPELRGSGGFEPITIPIWVMTSK